MSIEPINTAVREEDVEGMIEEIGGKISNSQGQVALSSRSIVIEKSKGCLSSFRSLQHTETGVISGGLVTFELEKSGPQRIKVRPEVMFDSAHPLDDYTYFPGFGIPVERKLITMSLLFGLNFHPEDLRKADKGDLTFSRSELMRAGEIRDYERRLLYLNRFFLLVGDGEVREFLGERGLLSQIEDFFRLMKTPGELERRLTDYDFKQREDLARNLVREVAGLCLLNQQILDIEGDVLKARYSTSMDQGGSTFGEWSNREVSRYESLRLKVQDSLGRIRQMFEKAGRIGLTSYKFIRGDYIGFPAQVNPGDYLAYVKEEVLSAIMRKIEKLDAHLREEERGK